jgi:hypothetical protein
LVLIPTTAQAKEHTGPCTGSRGFVTRQMPLAVQQQKVRWLLACFNLVYPVPGGLGYATQIAERESHLDPFALNESSGCAGVMQFARGTWDGLVDSWPLMNEWTGTWIYSARGNVARAMRLAHEAGWGPWT